jgi:hypothetical protein
MDRGQRASLGLLIGMCAVLAAAFTALGPSGDVTIADSCRGSAWEGWRHPLPEDAAAEFDYGRACNESATGKVHLSMGLLGLSVASLGTGAWPGSRG